MKGWIYILSNEAVPDWLAIGCSDSDPEALVRQYGNSGIKLPYPFELQYALRTPYPQSLLQKIHEQLADKCVNPDHNSDWFECDLLNSIRITRKIAGNSATGEAFYGRARQMVQEAQQKKQTHTENAQTTSTNPPTLLSDEQPEIKQVRTTPKPQHGQRPSPVAPKISSPQPAALTEPDTNPQIAPTETKPDNPKLVMLLIAVWVMLMVVVAFLGAYVFGYI